MTDRGTDSAPELENLSADNERLRAALRRRVEECGCGDENDGTCCVWCAEDMELLDA